MSRDRDAIFLVFTDLDGSLLDHDSYSYRDALPALQRLGELDIPVIIATSKTRAEVEPLREELGNRAPFIVENGAAVYIPEGLFSGQPAQTSARDGYWVREAAAPRERWLALLDELGESFAGEFDTFARAGSPGIARLTGLSEEAAALANQREYSEPVLWLGSPARREAFTARLRAGGARPLQGGRFLAVSGDCDKGRALAWLRDVYRDSCRTDVCHDLAIGDSGNDCAMLEAAQTALVVRSPAHGFPPLARSEGVIYSTGFGPAGWAEGVARWLSGFPATSHRTGG
jgi:mannosyl-3-phosphoglycerate phosphatase family protein